MDEQLKEHLTTKSTWMRALYMVLFVVLFNVAELVMAVTVILQFLFSLIGGTPNQRLLRFGAELSQYIYQILQYLTYNSEERPFPFGDWPRQDEEPPVVLQGEVVDSDSD